MLQGRRERGSGELETGMTSYYIHIIHEKNKLKKNGKKSNLVRLNAYCPQPLSHHGEFSEEL